MKTGQSKGLEEITQETHDQLFEAFVTETMELFFNLLNYEKSLLKDKKEYNIRYFYDSKARMCIYQLSGKKHMGYKIGEKDDESKI